MRRRNLKFLFIGTGIAITMGFLLAVGIGTTDGFAYYLTVSEFLEQGANRGSNFRINGKVLPGSIERKPSGQEVVFVMTDGRGRVPVHYRGIIPDTFVDEADVVVEGTLDEGGTFQARNLLAKCPSKYEAADGAESGYAPASDSNRL